MGEERENLERESESDRGGEGGGVEMETPQRNKTITPVSKFEESPVYNFINNLSPIKPVKSTHITQTFSSLIASLPSVFTSPHVCSPKESRFLRRHQFSDPSKAEFCSVNEAKFNTSDVITDVAHKSAGEASAIENFDLENSGGEASAEPSHECSKFAIELPRTLACDCNSPDCNSTPCHGAETKCVSELAGTSSLVQYVSKRGLFGSETRTEKIRQIEQHKEAAGCDWGRLFSDAADLVVFESPNGAEAFNGPCQKSLDPGTRFCSSLANDLQTTEAIGVVSSSVQHRIKNMYTQPGEEGDEKEIPETRDMFTGNSPTGGPSEKIDDEPVYNLYRGMRRRSLVFEIAGTCKMQFDEVSSFGSSMSSAPDGNICSIDRQLVPLKPGNNSARCILPGIGLHLNALATNSKDYNVVKLEDLASGIQLINSQEPLNNSLGATSSEVIMDPIEDEVSVLEEASQASGYAVNEEFIQSIQSSPIRKRRRVEHAGETEACKRCNCKKSKCLKLYCECFAAGLYCVEPCSCQECFNKPVHEETVLATRKQIESRNPLAFAPRVIRSIDSIPEIGDDSNNTPASARHKRGCNCKKSGCLKKYCECYQGGVGCSIGCRCEGCKNVFGRKDGSAPIETEAELEEETTETYDKSVAERSSHKFVMQNDAEHNTDYVLPATPLRFFRQSPPQPFSSKCKPPISSFLSVGSSSWKHGRPSFGKPEFFRPQPNFDKHFQTVQEDEMPPILQGNCSPINGVKSASPNSKRVSPPHNVVSLGRRSGRKLILQSIPSFPLLTPKH